MRVCTGGSVGAWAHGCMGAWVHGPVRGRSLRPRLSPRRTLSHSRGLHIPSNSREFPPYSIDDAGIPSRLNENVSCQHVKGLVNHAVGDDFCVAPRTPPPLSLTPPTCPGSLHELCCRSLIVRFRGVGLCQMVFGSNLTIVRLAPLGNQFLDLVLGLACADYMRRGHPTFH